jgi:hypothetical protein
MLFCQEQTHTVHHALLEDLSSPSFEAWSEMSAGRWEEDPNFENAPDDEQIRQTSKMRAGIEFFAQYGYPQASACNVNALDDGVWEFKLGRVRISFFDTDGQGNYTPKARVLDIRDSDFPEDDYWWVPLFDDQIRLGHCFGKTTQQTEPADIARTLRVREEDLSHDRP